MTFWTFQNVPTIFVYYQFFRFQLKTNYKLLMKAIQLAIVLILTLSVVRADLSFSSFNGDFSSLTASNGAIALQDLITVANYFGCKTWVKNQCTQCSQGFHFSQKGVCCEVPSLCSQFNLAQGVCIQCYQGYSISNGTCKLAASDNGCAAWNGTTCAKCSQRWFFNNGVCSSVSDQCYTWDSQSGSCLSCYNGYLLNNGVCSVNPNPAPGAKDPLCAAWSSSSCLACASRAYFNVFGACTAVSDQCQTWDPKSGFCLSCYGGYNLSNGFCNASPVQTPSDAGCSLWDTAFKVCLQCSQRYYFNDKKCAPVNDQCKTWESSTGRCTTCYNGYDLQLDGACQLSTKNISPSDNGCANWDWINQKCLQCSNNWVFNSVGVCMPVSDQCKTFDLSGSCLSCYNGYNLDSGKCALAPTKIVADVGCGLWDWNNQKCVQCSNNWAFNSQKICVPVSEQCNAYDINGSCVSCYVGYNLVSGSCVLASIQAPSDVGCATWDWKAQKCLQCSNNWVFKNGVCVTVSDQCNTFDLSGNCVSCYKGYNLVSGKCVLAPIESVQPGCASWDWDNRICKQCSNRWVLNSNKKCVPVNDNCQKWDNNGSCTSCYAGYVLNNGSCSQGNPLCLSSNSNGACTICYTGYILDNGNCVPISKLANLALYYSLCCPERLAASSTLGGSLGSHVSLNA